VPIAIFCYGNVNIGSQHITLGPGLTPNDVIIVSMSVIRSRNSFRDYDPLNAYPTFIGRNGREIQGNPQIINYNGTNIVSTIGNGYVEALHGTPEALGATLAEEIYEPDDPNKPGGVGIPSIPIKRLMSWNELSVVKE
jgi:hypothetical protein